MPRPKKLPAKAENEVQVKAWQGDDVAMVEPKAFPMVYTNNARISFNNWDASILFGEIVGDAEDKLLVVPKVKVAMSLPFALELRDLLVKNIAIFEDKFGPIHRIGEPKADSE